MDTERRTFLAAMGASAALPYVPMPLASPVTRQDDDPPIGDDLHALHLSPADRYDQLMDVTPAQAYDGSDVTQWQRQLSTTLRQLAKFPPIDKRPPLNTRSLWKRAHELGEIEKIAYASEPNVDVPAYVCTPKDVEPPYTWFVCVQGHTTGFHNSVSVDGYDDSKAIDVGHDRDFGLGCMRRGVAAICIEQRGFGVRRWPINEGLGADQCRNTAMHSLMIGRTLIGERVFDVDRAIDYLLTRDDVDPKRIGVLGNSGGGTTTVFSAALLDRVRYAMPSCYFCTFRASIMAMPHCMCNYIPGLLEQAEMADVLGLFAPRPVVIVAGREDRIFPIDGVMEAYAQLKRIYEAAGAGDRCELVVGEGGHRFYADLAWPKMLEQIRAS